MLASFSHSDKVNNTNAHSTGFVPSMSSTSSSLDYLYQAINLIEQSKNSSTNISSSNISTSNTLDANLNQGF